MHPTKVAIIVAMPEELRPLLTKIGRADRRTIGTVPAHFFSLAGREVCAVASGMGMANADRASRSVVDHYYPHVLISAGFAGGVTPEPRAGDVIVARRIVYLKGPGLTDQVDMESEIVRRTWEALSSGNLLSCGVHHGTFITSSEIVNKKALSRLVPSTEVAAVEMESAAIARVAMAAGIPFMGIRTISDTADEELGFCIDEFTDAGLNVRLHRVLLTMVRKPWILPQLLRLAANSRTAGKNLATALVGAIEII